MTVDTLGRALAAYRRTTTSRSAMLLIAVNAIPVVGVLFFGWSLLTILVLYWLENGIVGFWNIPKIALAQTGSGRLAGCGRTAMAAFFLIHYGMFWFAHGIFVFALPAFGNGFELDDGGNAFGTVNWESVALAGGALFLSHGASFLFNYVGRAEYRTASPAGQMGSVYGRVVVLHLTIIVGSFLVAFLGAPIGALLVLVVLKTAFDLGLHLRERRAADARVPADTAYGWIDRDEAPPIPPGATGPA